MKAHSFDPKDPFSITEFLAAFKLACDIKDIHRGAASEASRHYIKQTLENTLISRICARYKLTLLVASVQNEQPHSRKLLRLQVKVANYFLKTYATRRALAIYHMATLRFVQQTNMTPQQFAKNLIAMYCNVENLYDRTTLNDVLIEDVDAFICHSLRIF